MPSPRRICTYCEAACGLLVTLEGRRVLAVEGDPGDPFSRGYLCTKAHRIVEEGRDRLSEPVSRQGDGWVPTPFDEAIAVAAAEIARIQAAYGRDSVAVCFGNPVAYDYATIFFSRLLLYSLSTANRYSTASLDGLPHLVTSRLMFGNQMLLPVPDIDRTDLFVVIGANPMVSNGSLMSAPGMPGRLRELQRRGGRLVVIDPRRSETARLADQYLPIRPGTDPALLLAVLRRLLREHRPAGSRLLSARDADQLAALSDGWDCDRAAAVTGVPAAAIAELADALATARTAVCYGRIGVAHQQFSTLTCLLINLVNLVTGNLDRPGGAMFTRPALDLVTLGRLTGDRGAFGSPTRVRRLPTFSGERPLATLADEIAVRGPGSVRALVTVGANLVLSVPNGRRLEGALGDLEFFLAIDAQLNETTRHAHLVIPPAPSVQRDQYGVITSLVAVRNVVKYVPPAVPPDGGQRADWQIVSALHRGLAGHRRGPVGALHRGFAAAAGTFGPRRMLTAALLAGPYGLRRLPRRPLTVAALLARHPEGRDLGPLIPMLRRRRVRVRAVPAQLETEIRRLDESVAAQASQPRDTLLLIGRRRRRALNSWSEDRPATSPAAGTALLINPADAAARGIADGARVRIRARAGSLVASAALSPDMMTGVVSLPHGCRVQQLPDGRPAGPDRGAGLNDLTDELALDAVSGTAAFTATPVRIEPER